MATLRKQISNDHVWFIINYFYRAIKEGQLEVLKDIEEIKASQALKKLMEEQDKDRLPALVQSWVEKYISQAHWRKCLGVIRQLKYRNHRKSKMLTVDGKAYHKLRRYAKKAHLSFSEAIEELLKKQNAI